MYSTFGPTRRSRVGSSFLGAEREKLDRSQRSSAQACRPRSRFGWREHEQVRHVPVFEQLLPGERLRALFLQNRCREVHCRDDRSAAPGGLKRWQAEVKNRDKVLASFCEIQSRDEIFIRHHIDKGDPVPLWAVIEVVSIGTFSRFLRALRAKTVLEPVTRSLQLEDEPKLLQAVQNIAFLRNIAAHHGRLWNRRFDGHVTLPAIALQAKRRYLSPRTPAAALTLLAGMVDQIEGSTGYSESLLDLVHSEPAFVDGFYRPIL